MDNSSNVYLLPLRDDGSPDIPGGYVYLPPPTHSGYILRFVIEGTSSICREGSLWVNIPEQGKGFDRKNFRQFLLHPDFNKDIHIDILITKPGAFAFYTTYSPLPDFSTGPQPTAQPAKTPLHYIDVSPFLCLNGVSFPVNALSIFSVISKFMGKYPAEWEKHLRGISRRNYNMIHFTPLMARGESNSPYSIYDQLMFDPECFPNGEKDLQDLVSCMEKDFGLLALTDVVWNHTANNSKWLEEHPEAGYNVETAPWLEAALELDTALLKYGRELETLELPTEFKSIEDLLKVMDGMRQHVIDKICLWEFYVVDVKTDAQRVLDAWKTGNDSDDLEPGVVEAAKNGSLKERAKFIREHALVNAGRILGRYDRKINSAAAAALVTAIVGRYDSSSSDVSRTEAGIIKLLDEVNVEYYREFDADVVEMQEQVFNRVKYVRLDDHGPKLGPVTKKSPFIETYFTRLPLNETTKKHNPKVLALVNNGWIWNADAMRDNAGPDSRAYLRREVIVWGDCVKLRYGSGPADSPFLWDYMARYTRLMAKYFNAFRIDNCHSTPLVVAEYMLDEARQVRPNLAVFAELFTGSEATDYVFVKRLGLSALIREAMQAWSPGELSRLVHLHGGRPIGSFDLDVPTGERHETETVSHIRQSPVHALFMDCTHDNETPAQKRDARDTLPNAALTAVCASAIGSVMGYDEIYPKLVDLVEETRRYQSAFSDMEKLEAGPGEGGIGGLKMLLNDLHTKMGIEGYEETHIHHDGEYITVHRVHPKTRKGIFLITHTAFPGCGNGNGVLPPTHLTGTEAKLLGSWALQVEADDETKERILADKSFLRGLPSRIVTVEGTKAESDGHDTTISISPDSFVPGSIALFETWIPAVQKADGLDQYITSGAHEVFSNLNLVDLNIVLYRCDAEERDATDGKDGVYRIPNHGSLVYAGLQGWWSVLQNIIRYNVLGHPLCDHLRQGQWALDYIVGRLEKVAKSEGFDRFLEPAVWFRDRFNAVRRLPSFLLPRYFAIIIQVAYQAAWQQSIRLFSADIQHGQKFIQQLAMVSVQQLGLVKSASLWPDKQVPSLAAGLPHFAVDWARCWGRDVFISLRGLLLCTGRFAEAKEHIAAFGSVLKHGMIPNLLSSGKLPRYNSRDSVWFFLQAIQEYTKAAPDGIKLLDEEIPRRFLPYDDTWFSFDDPRAYSKSSTIRDIIQEVFQRHASGLSFREYNAGPNLDMQMKPEGFQIDVKVDWETGILFGGSQYNCGTWMDKMGESEKAGNKGIPGTPRDGAAVEIIGLLYSALKWVIELNLAGHYEHTGIDLGNERFVTFKEWTLKLEKNFERCFFIPLDPDEDSQYDVDSKVINRRGIYKDLYKSGKPYEDYQLRANMPIAMAVAPDLFTPEKALHALAIADSILLGPTGMATLDPRDLNYRPNYQNSEESTDFATSRGRNYHQGPEWLWPRGFFLRALLHFDLLRRQTAAERTETFQQITRRLQGCKDAIKDSSWKGLAELTNQNGSFCADSSPSQAWSAACLLDLYYDASHSAQRKPI